MQGAYHASRSAFHFFGSPLISFDISIYFALNTWPIGKLAIQYLLLCCLANETNTSSCTNHGHKLYFRFYIYDLMNSVILINEYSCVIFMGWNVHIQCNFVYWHWLMDFVCSKIHLQFIYKLNPNNKLLMDC